MNTEQTSVFGNLSKIDVSKHTEKKNGLTYLSWAWAWGLVKSLYPSANYRVVNYEGRPYLHDPYLGYLVTTEVTIDGETIPMSLPVMDGANKAQKHEMYTYKTKYAEKSVEPATMFDINTAIMRCLTKNLAMFGLGHYIYAGEDYPQQTEQKQAKVKQTLEPTHEKWHGAIEALQKNTCDINFIKERFILTPENEKLLIEQAQF